LKKEEVQEIIINISNMDKQELISYAQKVYIAKEDMDKKAFTFIQRALDIKMMNLREETTLSPMAVWSEIEED